MKPIRADKVLLEMAKTFKVKNKKYGDNYLNVGKVMQALFPRGITLKTEYDHVLFHWINWKVGKFTRFIQTGMTHVDSIHDDSVYGAMIEAWIRTNKPRRQRGIKLLPFTVRYYINNEPRKRKQNAKKKRQSKHIK